MSTSGNAADAIRRFLECFRRSGRGILKEALDKLARAVDERFFGQSRQKKWRNTGCISRFF